MTTRTFARGVATALLIWMLALSMPSALLAHSELKTPTPSADSLQSTPVTDVSGIFTDPLKKDGSSLELLDATGKSLAKGGVDPASDTRMVIHLDAPLVAGVYTVKWTTVATDGDLLRGEWSFTVAAASTPSPTPAATVAPSASTASAAASPAPSPIPSPAPSPSASGTTTAGTSDVLLPIIVALVLLGGGAAYLLTRRNRPAGPA